MDETPRDLVEFFTDSCDTLQLEEFIKDGLDLNEPLSLEDGHRPLHVAATSGNKDMVEALLERGVDVDIRDYRGNTALHYAAREGHVTVVRLLLHGKADPNLVNDEECSVLQSAVCFKHLEITRVLLSKGADVSVVISTDYLPPQLQDDKLPPSMGYRTLLSVTFELGNLPIIHELILAGADVVAESQKLMYIAIREKNLELVNLLLEKGVDVLESSNDGKTPLERAVSNGWYSLVEMFLDMKGEINTGPLLQKALSSGHLDIAKLLIERGAELSTELKNAALKCVLDKGHTDVAEWLFNHGPEVMISQIQYINYLVNTIMNGNIGMFHLILDKVDDINTAAGERFDNETVLIAATKKELLPEIDLLLEKGAKTALRNCHGHTALYYAIETESYLDIFKMFVKWGVSLNELIDTGSKYRALHKAVHDGKLDLVEYLLENGANVNAKDQNGNTPFHMIFQSFDTCDKLHLIKQFMDKGADLYQENWFKMMPINFAIGKTQNIKVETFVIKECFEIVGERSKMSKPSNLATRLIDDLIGKQHIFLVKLVLQKVVRFYYEESVLSRDIIDNCVHTEIYEKLLQYESSGINLLHCAAFKGDIKLSMSALRNGVNIDEPTKEGFTALQIALYRGNTELALHLINQGAKLGIQDELCLLPIHVALLSGYDDLVTHEYFKTWLKNSPKIAFKVPLLHLAVYQGSVSLVNFLLSAGLNINTRDQKDNTILHIAVKMQNCELVDLLLESGINMNAQDESGDTALHLASRQVLLFDMSLEIPQSLLRHNVDVNLPNSRNKTALYYAASTPLAELLLEKGVQTFKTTRFNRTSPSDKVRFYQRRREQVPSEPSAEIRPISNFQNEKPILAMLLENKFVDMDRITNFCKVDFASVINYVEIKSVFRNIYLSSDEQFRQKRQLDLIKVLIRQRFTFKEESGNEFSDSLLGHIMNEQNTDLFKCVLENDRQKNLQSILSSAIKNKKFFHVKLLLEKIDVKNDTFNISILIPDARCDFPPRKYGLVQMYLDKIKVNDTAMNSPSLVLVAKAGYLALTKILLEKGVNINSVDAEANTALHYAAASSNPEIFHLLLSRGAEIELFNLKNETPIYFAVKAGRVDVFESLLARGANLLSKDVHGNTLLHKTNSFEIAKILVNQGVQVNARNSIGRTALHCFVGSAMSHKATDTVALLVSAGGVLNVQDSDGMTALHLAAKNKLSSIIPLLVSNGADVDLRDRRKRTALHYAVENSQIVIAEFLLNEGALPDLKDEDGHPPLSLCTRSEYKVKIEDILNKLSSKERLAGLLGEGIYLDAEEESSCLDELVKLTSTYLNETFNLFEIFSSFRKPTYLCNEKLVQALETFLSSGALEEFPNYKGILKRTIKRSKRTRFYLTHHALNTILGLDIREQFFLYLPAVVWTHMLKYLSTEDLDNIIACGNDDDRV